MLTTVTGIVIRERSVGEQDKFIDLLTADQGVLEVSVRGRRKSPAGTVPHPSCTPMGSIVWTAAGIGII